MALDLARGRTLEAARELALKAQDCGAVRGASVAPSRTRTGASPHAGKLAAPAAPGGDPAPASPPTLIVAARNGRGRDAVADLGPSRRSGGSGSGGTGNGGGSEGNAGDALHAAKSTSDEELARRLHQQLNGPASPTALTRQRKRKQPVFYTPEVPLQALQASVVQAAGTRPPMPHSWSGWALVGQVRCHA